MSTEENIQTVKDFFAAIGRGDSPTRCCIIPIAAASMPASSSNACSPTPASPVR